jgi:hypothetical protein
LWTEVEFAVAIADFRLPYQITENHSRKKNQSGEIMIVCTHIEKRKKGAKAAIPV